MGNSYLIRRYLEVIFEHGEETLRSTLLSLLSANDLSFPVPFEEGGRELRTTEESLYWDEYDQMWVAHCEELFKYRSFDEADALSRVLSVALPSFDGMAHATIHSHTVANFHGESADLLLGCKDFKDLGGLPCPWKRFVHSVTR
jgi:hypothetical protein